MGQVEGLIPRPGQHFGSEKKTEKRICCLCYYIHKWVEVQALLDKEYYCVPYLLHRQCYNYRYMDARFKEKGIGLIQCGGLVLFLSEFGASYRVNRIAVFPFGKKSPRKTAKCL